MTSTFRGDRDRKVPAPLLILWNVRIQSRHLFPHATLWRVAAGLFFERNR